jgi:chemotaxis signal transduction protein
VGKQENRLVILLDLDKVLSAREVESLRHAESQDMAKAA